MKLTKKMKEFIQSEPMRKIAAMPPDRREKVLSLVVKKLVLNSLAAKKSRQVSSLAQVPKGSKLVSIQVGNKIIK